ncbi:transposase family protein, partial [Streptococcus pneumoniae]
VHPSRPRKKFAGELIQMDASPHAWFGAQTSIPQAKGRVERLNQTLQSRPPIELERNNIHTLKEANTFLLSYIQTFNEQFGNKTKLSVFEEVPNPSERNLILARLAERVVDSGHHIRFQNRYYIPTEQGKEVYFIRKTKALVIKAFDGDIYLNIADKIYRTKELLDHELYSKNFEQEPEQKKERRKYIPPQTHPWKLTSFKQYLHKNKKDYEEFTSEEIHSPQLQV